MDEISRLRQNLTSGDPELAAQAALRLADLDGKEAIPDLIKVAYETPNHRVRDAAVFALGEMNAENSLQMMFDLLKNPSTNGHRGSIAYAVSSMNCAEKIDDLAIAMTDEFFEVRAKILMALESIAGPANHDKIKIAVEYLDVFLSNNKKIDKDHEDDVREFIKIANEL